MPPLCGGDGRRRQVITERRQMERRAWRDEGGVAAADYIGSIGRRPGRSLSPHRADKNATGALVVKKRGTRRSTLMRV